MSASGFRKAALLVMGLEPTTAAELLKSAPPEAVTEIAAELAYLEASGQGGAPAAAGPVREFFQQLRKTAGHSRGDQLVRTILEGVLGPARGREVLQRIPRLVEARDPFLPLRSAGPEELGEALKGESAQVAGLVLGELPAKTSVKLLPLLAEDVRKDAVRMMAAAEEAPLEARLRVAGLVRRRLAQTAAAGGGQESRRREHLRKVALLLRGLGGELRAGLLQAIAGKDAKLSADVQELMVLWEDLPVVADRSLQQAMRGIDARRLALGLVGVGEKIGRKIQANISERQKAALEEETSLLGKPRNEDVTAAREEILKALRELTAQGMLDFEEG